MTGLISEAFARVPLAILVVSMDAEDNFEVGEAGRAAIRMGKAIIVWRPMGCENAPIPDDLAVYHKTTVVDGGPEAVLEVVREYLGKAPGVMPSFLAADVYLLNDEIRNGRPE